ncbi:allantoicase [Coprinopsis sp. MPI-PUGE-AT-0042]|nr:allantoicase [Coprinopsis sp. MPI-PUGE-AT-0042]
MSCKATFVPLDDFKQEFGAYTELSSDAIGARIVAVSDEFFAEASNLLKVEPSKSLKGTFGPNGALFDGWESRRHNPTYDWVIVQLGTSGSLVGFDVDTANFNGNEAPEASIEVMHAPPSAAPAVDDAAWKEVLPRTHLGPNSRHLFKVPTTEVVNFVKLKIYPDGGVGRFRVYGDVAPVHPEDTLSFDLAHVFAGGRVIQVSDQHFGVGANLILPGRGKDMGDGWETKRSRMKGHHDWAIIKLGASGYLEHVEIDTAHFKGNFPESCEIHATYANDDSLVSVLGTQDASWTLILPRTKLGPHRQHYFQLDDVEGKQYTHIKVTMYPDGGIKRVRVIGKKVEAVAPSEAAEVEEAPFIPTASTSSMSTKVTKIPVLPLTPEAFKPFGDVIQGYSDLTAAPKGTRITKANAGTADKFHKQTLLASSYPPEGSATAGISVYRCQPLKEVGGDGTVVLTTLERHPYTNQAFVPMGRGTGEAIADPSSRYLVVVARNGPDEKPDLKTLRAFLATSAQGVVYGTAVWHQPMTVLDKPMDLACVETQIGDGSLSDCEILELDMTETVYKLQLPVGA